MGPVAGQVAGYYADTIPFFKERDIAFAGHDMNMDWNPRPGWGADEGIPVNPVHQALLVWLGAGIVENLDLEQLAETASLVATAAGVDGHSVVYQSRSGPPSVPWLEPDVRDEIRALGASGVRDVVVSPVGFVSDHIEVLYDLDREAGVTVWRAGTAGTHPAFVAMIRELVSERLDPAAGRRAAGRFGPSPDACAPNCCLSGVR